MQWKISFQGCWRSIAAFLLITYSVACTHLPSGENAFDSFETCFASNLALAAIGGIGVGVLSNKLTRGITGDKSTGKTIGISAGIAATTMIAMTAWRKCGAVYSKSEVITPPAARPVSTTANITQTPRLSLDRLDVLVEGSENDPPVPEFDFTLATSNPAARDIKAQFRHRVEIVRFTANADDRLVLANDKDEPLRDRSGKEIPLEQAARMPREQLHWVTIAEEGKNDYVEDVVIQQGSRARYRHKLQIPPRTNLPLPLPAPMRYTLTIEAENMKTTRSVDFSILGSNERPKRYASSANASALKAGTAAAQNQNTASPAASSGVAAITNRKTTLFNNTSAQRKALATLNKGTSLHVEDRITAIVKNKPQQWSKVVTDSGQSGWLPTSHLTTGK